jgi:hypothetical protein
MMERDRKREGLRVCCPTWLIGVSVREYREIECRRPHAELGYLPTDLRAVRLAAAVQR